MTLKEFIKYKDDDDFSYLVIEVSNDQFYGFNLSIKEEENQAMNIVSDSDWYVVGWKVSRKMPLWVKTAKYWTDEIVEKNIVVHNNDCKIVDDNVDYESNDDTNNDVNVDDFDHDDYDDEEKTGVEDLGVKFGNDRTVDKNPYVNDKRNNCKGNLKDDSTYGNSVANSNTNGKIKICEDSIEKEVTMFDNIGDIKSHI